MVFHREEVLEKTLQKYVFSFLDAASSLYHYPKGYKHSMLLDLKKKKRCKVLKPSIWNVQGKLTSQRLENQIMFENSS